MTTPNAELADQWLDDVTEPSQPVFDRPTHRLYAWFIGPARLARRLLSFLGTTPGKLVAVTLALTIAIAAAGMSLAASSTDRHANLNTLLSSTEPMNNSAHNLYTSLSLADTIATTGFVQLGEGSTDDREAYSAAIDTATVAATESALGSATDDTRIRELILNIQRQLPVYTGMVETARANHRDGNAVAVNYMSNASTLMREDILPDARELFRLTSAKVTQEQKALTRPQWVPLSGFVAAVFFLLAAQWWLWRLTRRRFNRGFLAATVLLSVALAWVSIATIMIWAAGSQRFEAVAAPWEQLTASQIEAQQARTTETLMLVSRQATVDATVDFDATVLAVHQALDSYGAAEDLGAGDAQSVADARGALNQWASAHKDLVADLNAGRYDSAITLSTEDGAGSFNDLNDALTRLIADTRGVLRSYIESGHQATTALGGSVGFLTLLGIICVWLGIRPRLQEYL